MPAKKAAKKATKSSTRSAAPTRPASKGFTAEEKSAMRDRVRELKAAASGAEADESVVLEKLAEMKPADRAMGERLHAVIMGAAPDLSPRLWYGMPAYAKDGSVVCFFQPAQRFKTRYATLGFSDKASLDEGHVWPTSYALIELTGADEAQIVALVKKAVS
jgi:uncharacterized protein YdhG (YjbR/CyaY superfamily)